MICPKDGHTCSCEMRLAGVEPCKTTMEEIERLVDALVKSTEEIIYNDERGMTKDRPALVAEYEAARDALVATIEQDIKMLSWLLENHGDQIRMLMWSHKPATTDAANSLGLKELILVAMKG